ncbi:MAG: hypothetical protein QM742_17430 [Aquabacterium sp.]
MNRIHSAVAMASLALSCQIAQAVESTPLVIEAGVPTDIPGQGPIRDLQINARFDDGGQLKGVTDVLAGQVSALSPGSLVASPDGLDEALAVDMPFQRIDALMPEGGSPLSAPLQRISFAGGFRMTLPATLPNGKASGLTTGGTVSITGLTVDFAQQAIYGDITGANGVGTVSQTWLWTYGRAEGSRNLTIPPCPLTPSSPCATPSIEMRLSDLYWSSTAESLVGQSLGLTPMGLLQMANGFGSITISSVPESSTMALTFTGLMGLGALFTAGTRRRQPR